MASTNFTMPELPGFNFEVVRGGTGPDGESIHNWIQITGKDENGNIVSNIGFVGP